MKSISYRRCYVKRLLCLLTAVFYAVYALAGTVPAQEPSAPSPGEEGSVESEGMMKTYIINPLDMLMIVVYAGNKLISEERQKYVQSDGTVYLSFIEDDVEIGGLMVLEAQKKLEDMARQFIREPRVVITVMSSYSQSVSTYGKINNRSFNLNTPTRILQLIAQAGGPNEDALEDSVRIISKDGSIRYFNYRKVNKNPTNEENFFLKPGDIVYVPGIEDFSVIVFGEVRTSGVYEMERGDRLLDALVKAGSWTSQADIRYVRILRVRGKRDYSVMEADMKDIFNKGDLRLNYELQDGDMIYVPLSRSPIVLQYWATFFGMLQSILYIFTLYQVLKE